MLLGILLASLLRNMLAGKVILRAGYGTKKVKGMVRAGYGSKNVWFCLILLLILTYKCTIRMNLDLMEFILEIICLKNTNEEAYVINLGEYADVGSYCIVLYLLDNNTIYFDSFEVKHAAKKIRYFIGNKNM